MSYVRSIPVRDQAGVGLTVHEFQDRRFLRKVKRWVLCSGESVEPEGDGFVILETGERLTLVATPVARLAPLDC